MSVALHTLFVALSVLTAIITFVALVTGDEGEKKAKNRLINWWAWIGDHGFTDLVKSTAALVDRFFEVLLGRNIIGFRAFSVWWGVCSVFVLSIFGGLGDWTHHPPPKWWWVPVAFFGFGLIGAVLDFPFLAISRVAVRGIMGAKKPRTFAIVYFLNAYASYAFIVWLELVTAKLPSRQRFPVLEALSWPISLIWLRHDLPFSSQWFYFAFFGLSTSMIAPVMIVAFVMRRFRKQTEPIAMWLLERAAGSQKGVFAGITALLTAVTGLLSAFGIKGQ